MSWAKVDDHAHEHVKQLRAGAEACWLWVCGLAFANRQRARDGFIPREMVPGLYTGPMRAKPMALAAKLVAVGLWVELADGYQIHDYHGWNPTPEQVEAERAAGRRRAAESYRRRAPFADSSPEEPPKDSAEPKNPDPKKHDSSGSTPTPLHSTPTPQPPEQRRRAPRNFDEAMALPPQDRARLATDHPDVQDFCSPERWPEVVTAAEALATAAGSALPVRLGAYRRDAGVRAVVGLLADGVPVEDIVRAVGVVARSAWWTSGGRARGLSSLTPEVVRRALAQPTPTENPWAFKSEEDAAQ